jgi:predicted phosphodiesterase
VNPVAARGVPGQGGVVLNRVAVLSDVHGVLPALRAVLAEPDVAGADAVLLTGDVAAGPQPAEVLDLLAGLGERAVWVRGNADRELVELARGADVDVPDPIVPFAAGRLRPEQVAFLAALPLTATRAVRGLGEVLFCHATPRDDAEVVLVDSPLDRWTEVLAGVPAATGVVVCGHTHMPFTRLVDRRLVVNPGSVGMPYGTAGAHWALLGGDSPAVRLRRTPFDAEAACAEITAAVDHPGIAEWVDFFVRNPASDTEALAAFRPRADRSPGST